MSDTFNLASFTAALDKLVGPKLDKATGDVGKALETLGARTMALAVALHNGWLSPAVPRTAADVEPDKAVRDAYVTWASGRCGKSESHVRNLMRAGLVADSVTFDCKALDWSSVARLSKVKDPAVRESILQTAAAESGGKPDAKAIDAARIAAAPDTAPKAKVVKTRAKLVAEVGRHIAPKLPRVLLLMQTDQAEAYAMWAEVVSGCRTPDVTPSIIASATRKVVREALNVKPDKPKATRKAKATTTTRTRRTPAKVG